jgi:hypothetical protein
MMMWIGGGFLKHLRRIQDSEAASRLGERRTISRDLLG